MSGEDAESWVVVIGEDGGIKWAKAIENISDVSLDALQKGVGGLIERVSFAENAMLPVPDGKGTGNAWAGKVLECYVNEEGLLQGMGENVVAGYACYGGSTFQDDGPKLFGPTVFIVERTDEPVSAQEWMMEAALSMGLAEAEAEQEIEAGIMRKAQQNARRETGIVWADYEV